MKFAKLTVVAAAALMFAAPAFAAANNGTASQNYTADNIKQICSGKKNPEACMSRRHVGSPVSKRDQTALSKAGTPAK